MKRHVVQLSAVSGLHCFTLHKQDQEAGESYSLLDAACGTLMPRMAVEKPRPYRVRVWHSCVVDGSEAGASAQSTEDR